MMMMSTVVIWVMTPLQVMMSTQTTIIDTQFSINLVETVTHGGLVVSMLDTGPKVCGFKPGRGWCIFNGNKNPKHDFLQRVNEAVNPMS
jgi:hypothetical protein